MSLSRLLLVLLVLGMSAQLWAGLDRATASDETPALVTARVELPAAVSAAPPDVPIAQPRGVVVSEYEARRLRIR
jgi:hypothetical protein